MASYSVALDVAGKLESLEVNLAPGAGETGRITVLGEADAQYQAIGLTSLFNGQAVDAASFRFASTAEPHSGNDAPKTRTRSVSLQDYTSFWDEEVLDGGLIGLPPTPPRLQPVLYDIDKPLGSDLPDAEECEEQRLAGGLSLPLVAAEAVRTYAGQDVFIIPGPGFVAADEPDYSAENKTVSQILNELLLTNGVRWWLEGDLLIVDGRALPSGTFTVPAADRKAVISYDWSDAFATPEREPQLADFLGRCAENASYEEGAENTFETSDDATLTEFSESGSIGYGWLEGTYQSVRTVTQKSGGRIVSETEEGRGYRGTPDGPSLGQTYVTVKTYEYHPLVRDALVSTSETTYTQPDYDLLEGLEGGSSGGNSVMRELWQDFLLLSPYISRQTLVTQRWNAEGLLRVKSEITREFAGLAVVGEALKLLYKEESRRETHTPLGRGLYRHRTTGRTAVDKPVYEVSEDEEAGAEPIGIMRDVVPFSSTAIDENPGETVSIPLPSCKEADSCMLEAERDYNREHAAWEARRVNSADKRTHQVRLAKLKFVRLGDSYGGGMVVGVSHSVARNSFSTNITVETAL